MLLATTQLVAVSRRVAMCRVDVVTHKWIIKNTASRSRTEQSLEGYTFAVVVNHLCIWLNAHTVHHARNELCYSQLGAIVQWMQWMRSLYSHQPAQRHLNDPHQPHTTDSIKLDLLLELKQLLIFKISNANLSSPISWIFDRHICCGGLSAAAKVEVSTSNLPSLSSSPVYMCLLLTRLLFPLLSNGW